MNDMIVEKESKPNDYRFLNKLFDNIDLETMDKRQLQKSNKFISDLNKFVNFHGFDLLQNFKSNIVFRGKLSGDSQQKILNLESVIRRSLPSSKTQTGSQSARELQAVGMSSSNNCCQDNLMSILERNDERDESINDIRKRELLEKIKNSLSEISKISKAQNKDQGLSSIHLDQQMKRQESSKFINKKQANGSLIAFQRGLLAQLKKKQSQEHILEPFKRQKLKRKLNETLMRTESDSLLSKNSLSKQDSLQTSLIESEIPLDKNNEQDNHIHIVDPLNEYQLNLKDLQPQQPDQNWNSALRHQFPSARTAVEHRNYNFSSQGASILMKKYFKGQSSARSLKNSNSQQTLTDDSQKFVYLKQQIAQTAVPSKFLHKRKNNLFMRNAPSILFAKYNHQKYVQQALQYNNGTLTKIDSNFLETLLNRNQTPLSNQVANTQTPSIIQGKRTLKKNHSVGMLRKEITQKGFEGAPITARVISPPFEEGLHKKLKDIGTGITVHIKQRMLSDFKMKSPSILV